MTWFILPKHYLLLTFFISTPPLCSCFLSPHNQQTTQSITTANSKFQSILDNPYSQSNERKRLSYNDNDNDIKLITPLYSSANDDNTASSSTTGGTQLTAQERILQQALGIEPENESERQERLEKQAISVQKEKKQKIQNIVIALVSGLAAILNYGYQYTHPITALSLLSEMQRNSEDVSVIGKNGKPTVVDFWAPWCENCKVAAPTLNSIENEYNSRVNFIMVNGDLGENWPLIDRFGVDSIPHLAFIDSEGYVETALIGPIPKAVLRADLDVLLERASSTSSSSATEGSEGKSARLPYQMYDAFRNKPDQRKVSF